MINFPDYMDIYLHLSIGLEPFEVVNISGYSNESVIEPGQLFVDTDEKIKICGLMEGWISTELEIDEPTVINLFRLNSAECVDGTNVREITIGDSSIGPGIGKMESSNYSVPIDCDAYILSVSSPDNEIIGLNINGIRKVMYHKWHKFKAPYRVEPASDITFTSDKDAYVNMQLVLMKRGL